MTAALPRCTNTHLDDFRVVPLAEDLEQVVVADEVKTRERRSPLLQEIGQRALAPLQLVQERVEGLLQVGAEEARVRKAGHLQL